MLVAVLTLSGCGVLRGGGEGGADPAGAPDAVVEEERRSTIWDIFAPRPDVSRVGNVNRYLWNASLETLSFLPVETVDPFTGVIVTGFGTPPGGGRAYRATILIDDPALDARSLKLALHTRGGPASDETVRAIEDAIMTRARQLRIEDSRY
jgi:hypothetical protein